MEGDRGRSPGVAYRASLVLPPARIARRTLRACGRRGCALGEPVQYVNLRESWLGLLAAVLVCAPLLLAGCASAPRHAALQGDALPPLIPARDFFANTASNGAYQVSPDGRWLAWVAVQGTRPALWLRPLEPADAPGRVVAQGLVGFNWAQDSRHVLYTADRGGDENSHVYALDVLAARPQIRDLTPHPGIRAVIFQLPPQDLEHVLVLHNRRDPKRFDLYRIHIASGRETLLREQDAEVLATVANAAGRPVAEVRRRRGGAALHSLEEPGQSARELLRWTAEEQVLVLGADAEGRGYHLLSDQGRDTRALVHLDAATGRQTLLAEDADVDVESVWWSARQRRPWAAISHPGHQRLQVLDADWQRDLARWFPDPPRRLNLLSVDRSEQLATLMVDRDGDRRFLLADRRSGRLTELGQGTVNAHADRLGVMRPVQFPARDGLLLRGYLTEPPAPAGPPRRAPAPMVLLVHGGPWARDHWDNGLNPVQFLVNRGYAVLQVNYRGSTGYGRRFLMAAQGEFAGRMHDDLLDAVDWAVTQGLADPQRVAIMGASYGGYATLVGLSFTPKKFACGVDMFGMSDLVSLLENAPPYWEGGLPRWHRFVGNPAVPAQRERMKARSPLTRVDAIERPLLVVQGANDVRVRRDQSDRLVEALRARGQPVEYLVVENGGHVGNAWRWSERLRVYRAVEDFLAGCLGGRSGGFDLYQAPGWVM